MAGLPQMAGVQDVVGWLRAHPAIKQPLSWPERRLATRLGELDALLSGGLPRGVITEVVGKPSSGRTALVLAAVGKATASEMIAWIDPEDALDARSVAHAAAVLDNFLWVRPSGREAYKQALRATDLVLDAGGFGAVVLDLAALTRRPATPTAAWVRLSRRLHGTPTAFIALSNEPAVGSAAHLRLSCAAAVASGVEITVTKQRGVAPGARVLVRLAEPVD